MSGGRISGENNKDFVENLFGNNLEIKFANIFTHSDFVVAAGIIKSKKVARVMKSVDRANYCKRDPYVDCPQSIGTILFVLFCLSAK
jgi:hypothetical protein